MILIFSGIFILGLVVVGSADDSSREDTITPVSMRDHTYAKPTTVHKRINVQRIVENVQISTVDPFTPSVPDARRQGTSKYTDLWSWDLWCHLQPKIGHCTESTILYYYDTQLDACISFTYSGCGGNQNSFNSVDDCQRHCKGAAYVIVKEPAASDSCELQPSAGLCMALIPKYYYDVNSRTCKEFSYGGCGGNQNRYDSKAECETLCHIMPPHPFEKDASKDTDLWNWDLWCHLQPKYGSCNANTTQYYYDTQLDACYTFTFSGCGGNKNNFYSEAECMRYCKGVSYVNLKESAVSDSCVLQPSAGPCTAYVTKYYYYINSETCKEFSYGGCGGNQNRYERKDACETECPKSPGYRPSSPLILRPQR